MIGRNGERGSGIFALAVRHDDDDMVTYNFIDVKCRSHWYKSFIDTFCQRWFLFMKCVLKNSITSYTQYLSQFVYIYLSIPFSLFISIYLSIYLLILFNLFISILHNLFLSMNIFILLILLGVTLNCIRW